MRKSREAFTQKSDGSAIPGSDISVPGPVLGMQDQLIFEKLVSDISAKFVNIFLERVDEEIQNAMQKVLDFFKVDRFALLEAFPDNDTWIISHCVTVPDLPPVPIGTVLPRSINPWGFKKLIIEREMYVIFENIRYHFARS